MELEKFEPEVVLDIVIVINIRWIQHVTLKRRHSL